MGRGEAIFALSLILQFITLQKCESIKLEVILNNFGGIVSGPVAFLRVTCFIKDLRGKNQIIEKCNDA